MHKSPFAQAVSAFSALEQLTTTSADEAVRRGQALDFARKLGPYPCWDGEDAVAEVMLDRMLEEGFDGLDEQVLASVIQKAVSETRAERRINHEEMRKGDALKCAQYRAELLASKRPEDRLQYMRLDEGFSDLSEELLIRIVNRAIRAAE